jgi:hypothetical protein
MLEVLYRRWHIASTHCLTSLFRRQWLWAHHHVAYMWVLLQLNTWWRHIVGCTHPLHQVAPALDPCRWHLVKIMKSLLLMRTKPIVQFQCHSNVAHHIGIPFRPLCPMIWFRIWATWHVCSGKQTWGSSRSVKWNPELSFQSEVEAI